MRRVDKNRSKGKIFCGKYSRMFSITGLNSAKRGIIAKVGGRLQTIRSVIGETVGSA